MTDLDKLAKSLTEAIMDVPVTHEWIMLDNGEEVAIPDLNSFRGDLAHSVGLALRNHLKGQNDADR